MKRSLLSVVNLVDKAASRSMSSLAISVLCLLLMSSCAFAVVKQVVLYQPSATSAYQLYIPSTKEILTLTGTEKMKNVILADIDGNGREDDIVYANSAIGGLGYYKIPTDGKWNSIRDFRVPNAATDAVPLTVIQTGSTASSKMIVYRLTSTGYAYARKPDGTSLRSLGKMDKAFAVDARILGYKGDLAWWTNGVGMRWREGIAGIDHPAPWPDLVPLGGGKVISSLPNRTIAFYSKGVPAVYMCDRNWNFTKLNGMSWTWVTNTGSMLFGDVDGDAISEIIYVKSTIDPLQWYNVPASANPWNSAGEFTELSIKCGWNLHGVGAVDIVTQTSPPPPPPPGPTPVPVTNISSLNTIADGTVVQLTAKPRTKLVRELINGTVTITGYYIEETDRSAGIRVLGTTSATQDQLVTVQGTLSTQNGERVIMNSNHTVSTLKSAVSSLVTSIKALFGTIPMTGLLIQTAATIPSAVSTPGYFTATDSLLQSIKVYCPDSTYPKGAVNIIGCVGCEKNASGITVPVIRVESASDIKSTVAPPPPPPSSNANYSVWAATCLDKVLKTDPIQTLQVPTIKAACNEQEAFQLVLRGKTAQVSSVSIAASPLVSSSGQIAASNVSLFLPYYVNLPALGKDYPDALPPYQGPFNLAAGQTQPIWIDIFVPKGTPAGDYNGTITITDASGAKTVAPYVLHVYGFTLPDTPACATEFGIWQDSLIAKFGVARGSAAFVALHKKFYEMLLQHRISSDYFPVDYLSAEADSYYKDPRMSSFVIPWYMGINWAKQALAKAHTYGPSIFAKHWFYPIDEPSTQSSYDQLKSIANQLHSADPEANVLVPYYRGPDFSSQSIYSLLTGYIDTWCPTTDAFDVNALNARRAAGDKIWSYVATGPSLPYCSFHVNYEVLQSRMVFWQNYLYNATGFLYWSATYWQAVSDPWTNINTVNYTGAYGGGSLMYPGTKVGINGPVSSIRLKNVRDGLDDYDYLALLEKKMGRAASLQYVQKLTQSWTSYTRDRALFQSVRDQIAQAIEN